MLHTALIDSVFSFSVFMEFESIACCKSFEKLDEFNAKWGVKYPLAVQFWQRNRGELATFFKCPKGNPKDYIHH